MRTTESTGSRLRSLFGGRGVATATATGGDQERELWDGNAWAEPEAATAAPASADQTLMAATSVATAEPAATLVPAAQDHEPEDTVHDPIGSTERREARPVAGDHAARRSWDAVVDLFEKAAGDPSVAERVGRADLVVRVRALDLDGEAILLDARGGLEVLDDGSGADVDLGLATGDLERLADGRLRMAMAIAAGRAPYSGPIRRFLWVLPVVQAMARPPVAVGSAHADDDSNEDLA
jgi:hypothetical protein